ncbi:MAG: hypothetical protein ACYDB8_12995 [Acidiferrobacterales bacterium]
MTDKTAWAWRRKIRQLMYRADRDRLVGFIELTTLAVPQPVVVMVTRTQGGAIGATRIVPIVNLDPATILKTLPEWICPGSYVVAPSAIPLEALSQMGYRGRECSGDGPILARKVAEKLRRSLGSLSRKTVAPPQFSLYLSEFVFRFNRCHDPIWEMVGDLVAAAF